MAYIRDDLRVADGRGSLTPVGPPIPPVPASAATSDRIVISIRFNRRLSSGSVPPTTAFAAAVDAQSEGAVEQVAVSGRFVHLMLEGPLSAGDISVSYSPDTPPLLGWNGAEVEAFSDLAVADLGGV